MNGTIELTFVHSQHSSNTLVDAIVTVASGVGSATSPRPSHVGPRYRSSGPASTCTIGL